MALVLVAYFLLSTLFVGVFSAIVGNEPESVQSPFFVFAGFLAPSLASALVVVLPTKMTTSSVGLRRTSGRWLLIGAGLGLLGWLLSVAISALHARVTGDEGSPRPELSEALSQATTLQFALSAIMASTLVPFAEELLFRGVLYTWLRRWGIAVAVSISALFFGLSHGLDLILLISAALGVITAVAYESSGSLWPAVVAHATMNASMSTLGHPLPVRRNGAHDDTAPRAKGPEPKPRARVFCSLSL